jgi:hypothetical protein
MSTEHKGVMPSSPDFSAIDPEVYFLHIAMNPQCHFDLAAEFADPLFPDHGTRETPELTAFISSVERNLKDLLDGLR